MAMRRWFPGRHVIERACGHNDSLAVARGVRNRAIAVAANLPREAFRFGKIETLDQLFPLCPAKLSDRHSDVRRTHPAGSFAATRAVTMPKPKERRADFVAHRLT